MTIRIGVLPLIGNAFLAGESDHLAYMLLMKEFLNLYDVEFTYFIPDYGGTRGSGYTPHTKKIKVVKETWTNIFYDQEGLVTEQFKKEIKDNPVDIIFTSRACAVPLIKEITDVPIMIFEPKASDFSGTHQVVSDIELTSKTLGYAMATTIFWTPFEKSLALRAAGRYLKREHVKFIDDNSHAIPLWINCKDVDRFGDTVADFKEFTILWQGRPNTGAKRIKKAIEICRKFFQSGNTGQILFSSPAHGSDWRKKEHLFPEFKFEWDVTREKFLELIGRSTVCLNCSTYEGFSAAVAEMLASGTPVLLPGNPKYAWVRAQLGEMYSWYPFFWTHPSDAVALLKWIKENPEEAGEKAKEVRDFVFANWDVSVIMPQLHEIMTNLLEKHSCASWT